MSLQSVNCNTPTQPTIMRFIYSLIFMLFASNAFSQEFYLFIGTYTNGESKGLYVYRFNAATGEAQPVSIGPGVENPSYCAVSPNGEYVYAVNQFRGDKPSTVSAFKFDKSSGELKFLNKQSSGGDGPCYVSVDATGKWVTVGNYTAGTLSAIPVDADGSLNGNVQLITHTGKSVHPQRQDKPHVHAVVFAPDNRFMLVPDLGLDKIVVYKFDAKAKQNPLSEAKPAFAATTPGSGPRHVTFHPSLPYAYLIEEMAGYVSAYKYKKGKLEPIQRINSHPEDFKGDKGSADIHVSPDGKFLYASNRGTANSIATYAINSKDGKLALKSIDSTRGTTPRNFVIDPTGNYLLVAHQNSSNVVIFKRDLQTGLLTYKSEFKIPNAVCLKMLAK